MIKVEDAGGEAGVTGSQATGEDSRNQAYKQVIKIHPEKSKKVTGEGSSTRTPEESGSLVPLEDCQLRAETSGEKPEQVNCSPKSAITPAKLGGGESRGEGADHEIQLESSALCSDGPLAELGEGFGGPKEEEKVEKESRAEKGYQVGLLEGQGTPGGTLTPPEPTPWADLEGQGLKKEALTPQGAEGGRAGRGKEKSLLEKLLDKAKEMEKKMVVVKEKTPSRKRKKTKQEEEEEQRRMVEQKRMRKVMDRWRRKETPDIDIVEPEKLTVRDVIVVDDGTEVTRQEDEVEKSTVQMARDRFLKLSKNQEDSFKVWKEKRVKNKEIDRSALASINNDMCISSMREGEGGADDRGEKLIGGGAVGPR